MKSDFISCIVLILTKFSIINRVPLLTPNCSWSVSYRLTFPRSRYFFYPEDEATRSYETSVYNKPTLRHIQEDGILHSHRRQNLKS
jgi:hypothetical protein